MDFFAVAEVLSDQRAGRRSVGCMGCRPQLQQRSSKQAEYELVASLRCRADYLGDAKLDYRRDRRLGCRDRTILATRSSPSVEVKGSGVDRLGSGPSRPSAKGRTPCEKPVESAEMRLMYFVVLVLITSAIGVMKVDARKTTRLDFFL